MDIFAGSLPFKLKEEDLKKLFEPFGEVTSVKIVIDKITRQNKGFGFIEMPNEEEAKNAIKALDGSEVLGRQIIVNVSDKDKKDSTRSNDRKKDNRGPGGGYKGGNGGGFNKGGFNNNNNNNKGGGFNKNNGGGFNKNKGGGFNRDHKRDNYRDDN